MELDLEEPCIRLLKNPWFSRAWTFQEFVVSRRCIVMIGQSAVTWKTFAACSVVKAYDSYPVDMCHERNMLIMDREQTKRFFQMVRKTAKNHFHKDIILRWNDLHPEHKETEIRLLNNISNFKSTKLHDKIYAMYAILRGIGIRTLPPNYDVPLAVLFQETTMAYISCREKLNILAITIPREESELPSWVPDWSADGLDFSPPLFEAIKVDTSGTRHFHRYENEYKAARDSRPIIVSQLDTALTLKGKLLGSVQTRIASPWVGAVQVDQHESLRVFYQTCRRWCRFIQTTRPLRTNSNLVCTAFSLFFDRALGGLDVSNLTASVLVAWVDVMLYPDCTILEPEKLREGLQPFFKQEQNNSEPDPDDLIFQFIRTAHFSDGSTHAKAQDIQHIVNLKANWALCLLDDGHISIAFHVCREGDRLALLAGLDFPVLLRPQGKNWRIVAPANVHGMMSGEIWPENEDELEEITLV